MPSYKYVGTDHTGKKVKGTAQAPTTNQLYKNLRAEFIYVHQAEEVADNDSSYKLKADELADFSRQIGTMQRTGIPVVKALGLMQEQNLHPKLRQIYQKIYDNISQGNDLSSAMEICKGSFPTLMLNMYKSGEASGNLDETCLKMAAYYTSESKLQAKIKNAMAYPTILAIMTVAITIGMFTIILPSFFEMFKENEAGLPPLTVVVIGISDFIMTEWPTLIFLVVAMVVSCKMLMKLPQVQYKVDTIKLSIPQIGELLSIIYTARFARTLSSLYTSGVTMIEAVEVSVRTIGNQFVEDQFGQIVEKIRSGQTLSSAMEGVEGLENKLVTTIFIGEETGRLDDMLVSVSEEYEFESDMAIERMLTYIEPIMIVIMAFVVGVVMMAVMVPVMNMSSLIA